MKKTNYDYNPDTPVLEFIAGIGKYVTHFMVAIICSCILYFTSCKFTYEWRVLQSEFPSRMAVSLYAGAYCLITDGSRIALLLYGLRDFALGKNSSGYFGIFISVALTGFAIYESDHIAGSITNSTNSKAFEFVYIGFIVTNVLALLLEWRMITSTKGLFVQTHQDDTDSEADEDAEIERELAPTLQAMQENRPPQFSMNYQKPIVVPQ